jgi:predicted transglutaminase-like cysteine proteinase
MAIVGMTLAGCQSVPGGTPSAALLPAPLPQTIAMPLGDSGAAPPAGFINFCLRRPDQCLSDARAGRTIRLDGAGWHQLERVNATVNQTLRSEDDLAHYGRAEYWNIPADGLGDCDDFALTKRAALIGAGFAPQALRIAIVLTGRGDRHAVLTVATDRGDYVLDNLDGRVRAWTNTDFTWVQRQDPLDAWGWVSLGSKPAVHLAQAAAVESVSVVVQDRKFDPAG